MLSKASIYVYETQALFKEKTLNKAARPPLFFWFPVTLPQTKKIHQTKPQKAAYQGGSLFDPLYKPLVDRRGRYFVRRYSQVHAYVCMFVCMYVCMCVCVCVCVCVYIYIYI
jgi:hypothetical protein